MTGHNKVSVKLTMIHPLCGAVVTFDHQVRCCRKSLILIPYCWLVKGWFNYSNSCDRDVKESSVPVPFAACLTSWAFVLAARTLSSGQISLSFPFIYSSL